jgi:hypothetical protein
MHFDRVVPGQWGDDVIGGLTGAKKISSLSPANPTRIIYRPTHVPCVHVAMRAKRGKVAIALMRRICF